ncbi:MAG TPA: hypothetical protein VFO65_09475, partial [Acidimicrobiales bacterium]|nr:hypothetical protein [Acidimicrobiales bacterium]
GRVTWRRDWRGILRWPAARLARLAGLGGMGGAAMAGAWSGTTPLVLVAGGCLFVAALEATEGLAQDIDHPDRLAAVPAPAGAVHLRHLAAPTVVLAAVGVVGVVVAAVVSRQYRLAVEAGLPLVVPAGAVAAGAAAVSELKGPPQPGLLSADATGLGFVLRQALPPLLATAGPAAALLLVREEIDNRPDVSVAVLGGNAAFTVALLLVMILGWVRHREGLAQFQAGEGLAGVGR